MVRRSAAFEAELAARSPYQPRLDRVLEGVEWALACNPTLNAQHVAGKTWVQETPLDIEAPTLWVYYTIEGDLVTLRGFHVVRTWEG